MAAAAAAAAEAAATAAADEEEPPLQAEDQGGAWTDENDPWQDTQGGAAQTGPRQRTNPGAIGTTGIYAGGDAPPMRIIHDIPPVWNGDHADKELEPYLKLLRGWLATTRTLKTQAGMTILNSSSGDLKIIINELEIEELCADTSGEIVFKHIQASYAEYMEKKLPQAIELGIYDKDVSRRRNESMLQY